MTDIFIAGFYIQNMCKRLLLYCTHSSYQSNSSDQILHFRSRIFLLFLIAFSISLSQINAQPASGASAIYGLRLINPLYAGNALQVRRPCDNGTKDIGFTSCGDLDTSSLKAFIVAAYPLNAITSNAATAFSLRKLRCAYSGAAICVRCSAAGSPTLDIGFTTNGDLDTTSLKTFIGSNSGFVTTWYDQSVNGRNAVQTATTSQPRIVNAGVIERQNSMPAIRWLGAGCSLVTAPFTAYSSAACFNGVAKVNTDMTYNSLVNKTVSNIPAPLDFYNSQFVIGNGTTYSFGAYGASFVAATPMSIWTYQGNSALTYSLYYNGANAGSGTTTSFGDGGNPLYLGSRLDNLTGLNGWISEAITFGSLPTAAERQYVEWSQGQYYSIAGAPILPALTTLTTSSGYVSIWYDQSGNGYHAAQSTPTNQPRIINTGIIEKNSSIPAINFTGTPINLIAPLPATSYPVSVSLLGNTSGNSTNGAFVKVGYNTIGTDGGVGIGVGASGQDFDNTGTTVVGLKEWSAWCPSNPAVNYPSTPFVSTTIQQAGAGGLTTFLNGTSVPLSSAGNTVGASISGNLYIGGYTNITNRYPNVKESEVLIFNSAISTTRKRLWETNQAGYYNVTVSGSKYTPPAAGTYNHYISGIGRESASDSVLAIQATSGMGIISGTASTEFLKDAGDYLVIGMNCPNTPTTSTSNFPFLFSDVLRWNNDWYLEKTDVSGNGGNVTIFFDFQDYGVTAAPGTASNYDLISRSSTTGNFGLVTVTTKSVSGARVYFIVNSTNLTNHNYYTIGTRNTSTSPLPVELLNFDAVCNRSRVDISWSTATQTNNNYFTIERTTDGVSFTEVGTVKGAGTSNAILSYNLHDPAPLKGVAYYRLKQTDYNGTHKYFKLVAITCPMAGSGDIKIYPNPNNGSFIVEGASPNAYISVINSVGETVMRQKSTALVELFNMSGLPDGVYFVKVEDDLPAVRKLVIQH